MKKFLLALLLLLGGAAAPVFAFAGSGSGSGSAIGSAAGSGSGSEAPPVVTVVLAAPAPAAIAPPDAAPAAPVATVPGADGPGSTLPPGASVSPDDPDFLDRLVSLWRSGAGVPVAILILFGLAVWASRRPKFAWLTRDHYAAWTAAILAGLGKLADIAATGVTPNQNAIIGAFAGIWLLLVRATPKPQPAPQPVQVAGQIDVPASPPTPPPQV